MGADGRLFGAGRVGESVTAAGPADGHGLGGLADTKDALVFACWRLLALSMVFAPWPMRNARVLHAFIPLRSTVGFELWVGNRAGASGFLDESQFPIFNRWEYDQYVAKGEVAYMRDKSALAKAYIRSHPGVFLRLSAVRILPLLDGNG